jgi:hypothetical protein
MRSLAFRLPEAVAPEALADRAAPCDMGAEWLALDPFALAGPSTGGDGVLVKWCTTACRYAQALV